MVTLLLALLAAQIQPPQPTPSVPATPPAAAAPAPRRPAPTSVNVEVRVSDKMGNPAPGARVIAEGPSTRNALADSAGLVTFRTLTIGTYRFRAEGDEFISLEKEVTLRAGMPPLEFALSKAPEPPPPVAAPPSAPAPAATAPTILPGEARVISLLDVAEKSLGGKEPVLAVPVACSGLSRAQLLVVRESSQIPAQNDADDMLYVIAGEASITVAGKTQAITSGWFSVVPRGSTRTVTRRGKNPVILLSIVGGPPCSASAPSSGP